MKNLRLILFAALAGVLMMSVLMRAGQATKPAQTTKPQENRPRIVELKAPLRVIGDPFPVFSGVTMDPESDEVVMADENRAAIVTYASQIQNTDKVMEPRREIRGPETLVDRVCSVTISPEFQEIFTVNKDIGDNMLVFPLSAKGNLAPSRELTTDHGAWGVFLDRKNDEIYITTHHYNKVAAYSRKATGDDNELRYIQGPKTGIASPEGVYVNSENDEIYVANHGHWRQTETGEGYAGRGRRAEKPGGPKGPVLPLVPSTGKFLPASITIHSRTASGDAAPLRTIQGPKTRLNWPAGVHFDTVSGQIAVANSSDNSILFFDRKADGDVAPVRVIKGPATGLANPTNLFVDTNRNEIWVTNWEDHSATVYPRTAEGNVAPIRVIRSAPRGSATTGLGGPSDIAYDPKRKEILVPN